MRFVSTILTRRLLPAVLATALLAVPTSAPGQDLRLGEVDFPNSGAAGAQASFARGLLLLHSFEYGEAAEAFRAAQEADPGFAMAYWGEAMTYNHPVWMQQDRDAAVAALGGLAPTAAERERLAGPAGGGTDREAAYMHAVNVLYGEGDGTPGDKAAGEKAGRDRAYAGAMAALQAAYPADPDAAAFHALALLGTAHGGRDFATYMESAGILEQVVDANPGHPGIAHYLIHSYDDPIHAPLGIRAARAYSEIAPDAPHAQHMTSHIFLALGMWDDVVAANENSLRVLDADLSAAGRPPAACGHYNFWLEYGYLQQGRGADALRLLKECYDRVMETAGGDAPDADATPVGSYAQMLARFVIDADPTSRAESGPLGWPVDLSAAPAARLTAEFARGWAAAERGDAAALEAAATGFAEARVAIESARGDGAGEPADGAWAARADVLALELAALRASLAGDDDAAVARAREAAEAEEALPLEFGPPHIDKPARELLGELLLKAGRPDEAREAFQQALARTPKRAPAEAGLALAERELQAGR
jgi:tetratricopeptide (TPR) repeat protein